MSRSKIEKTTSQLYIVTVKPNSNKEFVEGEVVKKTNRRENHHGLVRNIVYFVNEKKEVLNSKILLQYCISSKVAGNKSKVQYTPSIYGNCCNAEKSFFPLKKTRALWTDSEVKFIKKGKLKIGNLYDAKTNADNDDFPRSKKQLLDLSRLQLADNELGDILAYNEELERNRIIWHHSNISDGLGVLGTNVMINELFNATKVPISVKPTLNFARYELTYRSVAFECKSKNVTQKWVPVHVIGPTIIQRTKFDETYELAMRSVAKKCKLEIADETYKIADGENGLIKADSNKYLKSKMKEWVKLLLEIEREFLKQQPSQENGQFAL